MSILTRLLTNILVIYAAARWVSEFTVQGSWREYIIAGLALGLLNLFIKPVLKAISFPLILLTLGLFTLVINAALLWILDYVFTFVSIESMMALVWATLISTGVNLLISHKL